MQQKNFYVQYNAIKRRSVALSYEILYFKLFIYYILTERVLFIMSNILAIETMLIYLIILLMEILI